MSEFKHTPGPMKKSTKRQRQEIIESARKAGLKLHTISVYHPTQSNITDLNATLSPGRWTAVISAAERVKQFAQKAITKATGEQ